MVKKDKIYSTASMKSDVKLSIAFLFLFSILIFKKKRLKRMINKDELNTNLFISLNKYNVKMIYLPIHLKALSEKISNLPK